jgi:Flp pilus assembly pilin Flp
MKKRAQGLIEYALLATAVAAAVALGAGAFADAISTQVSAFESAVA